MYNSIYTSAEDLATAARFGNRSAIAFWTGSQITSGQGTTLSTGVVTGIAAGLALLYNAPDVVSGDLTSFVGDSGHMALDGLIRLQWMDVGGIGLQSLTTYGCESLATLYADNNSLNAAALNELYNSLPNRIGQSAGSLNVVSNPGVGSDNSGIAINKNWSFI